MKIWLLLACVFASLIVGVWLLWLSVGDFLAGRSTDAIYLAMMGLFCLTMSYLIAGE